MACTPDCPMKDFTMDLRNLQGNFFPAVRKRAMEVEVGHGFEIIQTFEPYPLYGALAALGFGHSTEKTAENEYHIRFCRKEKLDGTDDKTPFKPIALLNYPMIDEDLGKTAVDFWHITWNSPKRTIPFEMRLLLSLTNAVGAGRMRQASRELIKAYSCGVTSAMLDDVFELLAWNQGIGYFSSEIGPSPLFKAYKTIKKMESHDKKRDEIIAALMERFGEQNPEISVK